MAVVAEVAALKSKFEVHALPAPWRDLAFRIAIGETGLDRFDHVAQMFREHSKKEHDTLFVDRFVPQRREVQGLSVRGAVFQRLLECLGRNRHAGACVRAAGTGVPRHGGQASPYNRVTRTRSVA